MPIHPSAHVHDSAEVDPSAEVAPDAVVEHGAIIGPRVTIGPRTRVRARAIIVQDTVLGADNDVHSFCVLGGDPQDRAHTDETTSSLRIGDRNTFREFVTVNRGTGEGAETVIGDDCMMMAHAHVGHNAIIGNGVAMANSTSIAGHAVIGDRCVFSAFVVVHQFCEVGPGVMFHVYTGVSKHCPPFTLVASGNTTAGLNVKGLARFPGATREDRDALKVIYKDLFSNREEPTLKEALDKIDRSGLPALATGFVEFVDRALAHEGPKARGIVGGIEPKQRWTYRTDKASGHE